ncbi:Ig-like domain-containing protein [Morganella morganii]|uniref:Ig-like domain-containing protein n=1 Tax=Morganella morganii TaxID=582 RepID=UPI001C468DE9|nr:Ig-like domain-containing protein [Morganella morganii]QXO74146.1 Ig-like domain-containing protein [Morganella morganii]
MNKRIRRFPRLNRQVVTAWLVILTQLFTPLMLSLPARAAFRTSAADDQAVRETIEGMNAMMMPGQDGFFSSGSSAAVTAHDIPAHDNTVRRDDIFSALPDLGSPKTTDADGKKDYLTSGDDNRSGSGAARVAQGVSQVGSMLSQENTNALDASVGYARSMGENLINQQVTDWLNQFGHARVQFGSDRTGDADLLIPLHETPDSLLFSQAGIRANEDRTTANAGVGYRHMQDEWMWGVNTFWDHDMTGNNSRLGVGGELWADYLKVSANGYFRLTNWHQSAPDAMRDYDERPANGFDIRTEAYLPSYPQLGAFARYEQYFGDGIDPGYSTTPGDLKNNPSATTLGLTYTPVPLVTFRGQTAFGDDNDSSIGMDITYRFGVPLSRQLDSENVDLMRSLAGNRYDFVDRNYNIVMQYRKQELLSISLPARMDGEAAGVLSVPLTVNKAKYGLKSVDWSAPELTSQGGRLVMTSLTTASLTLPAYVFTRSNEPQIYRVSATGTDTEGNVSNTAVMWVGVRPSQETITSLTVTPGTPVMADNKNTFTAAAVVLDEKNVPLAGREITFTTAGFRDNTAVTLLDNSGHADSSQTVVTDSQGRATVKVRSKVSGSGNVKAAMKNGNSLAEELTFAADITSAQIRTLTLTHDKALANGKAMNEALATVQDQFGNPVENFTLSADASNGAQMQTPSQVTDAAGQITARFSNNIAGQSVLTVSGTGTQKSVSAQFMVDISHAQIDTLKVEKDNAYANDQAQDSVRLTVTDDNHNVLPGLPVTITVPAGAHYTTRPAGNLTDSQGQLLVNITSHKVGTDTYRFGINGNNKDTPLSFVADPSTAAITRGNLTVTKDNAVANGSDTNEVMAKVTDANGYPVTNMAVTFSAGNGAKITATGTTGADGTVKVTLTNLKSGTAPVTASVNNSTRQVSTTFTVDEGTVTISKGNLTVTKDNATANGTDTNEVMAKVTDASGNPAPGIMVNFSADNGATIAATGKTGTDGTVKVTLTSLKAGTIAVKATLKNGNNQQVNTTFVADSSTAAITKGNLTVTRDGAKADDTDTNEVMAKVTDTNGNPVANVSVDFSANNSAKITATGKTAADGTVKVTLTSLKAGVAAVTAKVNTNSQSVNTTFKADSTTATLTKSNLTVTADGAIANGKATNEVMAKVTDAGGNILSGIQVDFSANNSAKIIASGTTGADGTVKVTLTSTVAGIAVVTATVNTTSQTVNTTFVPDTSTAGIIKGNLTVTKDDAIADGKATNEVMAKVTDAGGNVLAGIKVDFSADNGAKIAATGTTGADGTVKVTLTSTTAGTAVVTAKTGTSGSQSVNTTFKADTGTATITQGNLTVTRDDAIADGNATNEVMAKVTDANGNVLSGIQVDFSANNGAKIAATGTTGADGTVKVTLTNITAGTTAVTAKAGTSGSQTVNTNFKADPSTATLAKGDLVVTQDNAVADGSATNEVQAKVTDANGNLLSGIKVDLTAANGAKIVATGTTGADGTVKATLTNTTAGKTPVTATISSTGSTRTVNTTFDANAGTATIIKGNLTVTVDDATADGKATNEVMAKVTDAGGNVLSGITVGFTADNNATIIAGGKTGTDGTVKVTLTSLKAGVVNVTATVNKNSQTVKTTFKADSSTANITQGNLTVTKDDATADGKATNEVMAKVTDANGNLVSGVTVNFTATNGASVIGSGTTAADGTVKVTLTNLHAGKAIVTAKVNTSSQSVDTHFTADSGTAVLTKGNLTVTADDAIADGKATNEVMAKVTDANGNLLSGVQVDFTATNSAKIIASGTTGADGTVKVTLTSLKAGPADVTATVNKTSQTVTTTFNADPSTATITKGNLTVTQDNAIANGTDTNEVMATVTDANGNLLSGIDAGFTADNGAVITATGKTAADGTVKVTLTSNKGGIVIVTATVDGTSNSQSVNTTFAYDVDAAAFDLSTGADNAIADGKAFDEAVMEVVEISTGAPISGVKIDFEGDNAPGKQTSVTTGANGKAVLPVTSLKAGTITMTGSYNGTLKGETYLNFIGDAGTATIINGDLTVTKDNAVADGKATNEVRAKVTDANGNVVPDVDVAFSADNGAIIAATGKTDRDGLVKVTLTSQTAGVANVTATVNKVSQKVATTFKVDETKLVFIVGKFAGANCVVSDKWQKSCNAIVQIGDQNGKPVDGVKVSFTAENGVTIGRVGDADKESDVTIPDNMVASSSDNHGWLRVYPVNTTVMDDVVITATLPNGVSKKIHGSFVADKGTATLVKGNLTVTKDNALADNKDTNEVQAKVTDKFGNVVPNYTVSFDAPASQANLSNRSMATGDDGIAKVTLTAQAGGQVVVTAEAGLHTEQVTITFTPDESKANIADGDLTVTQDNAVADGKATNEVQAKVTHANGKPFAGINVDFTADNGAVIVASGVSGTDGTVKATLTSTKAGPANVTAMLKNGVSQTVAPTFVGDPATALIEQGNLIVTKDKALADGKDTGEVEATVTDANGNLVPDTEVSFSADNKVFFTGKTRAGGTISASLTHTTEGSVDVTAALNNGANASVSVNFMKVSKITGAIIHAAGKNDARPRGVTKGFPGAGFKGAVFQLQIDGLTTSNSDYQWSSSSSSADVDQTGTVTLNSGGAVTITAAPKDGGAPLKYDFNVKKWFTFITTASSVADISTACQPYGEWAHEADVMPSSVNSMNQWPYTYFLAGFVPGAVNNYWVLEDSLINHYFNLTDGYMMENATAISNGRAICVRNF